MKKKRGFSLLLGACMVLMLLPAVSIMASAAETSAMTLGTDGISAGDEVYFGNYNDDSTDYNVPWIVLGSSVLSESSVAEDASALPLLSKYLLGTSMFQPHDNNSYYSGSTLQSTMSSIFSGFTTQEQGAVLDTTLTGDSMYRGGDGHSGELALTEQKLFPLSYDEADALGEDSDRLAYYITSTGSADLWWLRSSTMDSLAGCVQINGRIFRSVVFYLQGVRPALNLDLKSVLFASAAEGGKSSGAVGAAALNANLTPISTTEWKLTLEDTSRNFVIDHIINSGNTVYFDYSGATPYSSTTAPDEYISAIITDNSGNITYYGRIAQPSAATGTASIDLSSVTMNATDKLYVFSEQCNGDKKTDYASKLQLVSMTVNAYPITYALADLTTNGVSYVSNDNHTNYTATLSADLGYLLPASISVTVGGTAATLAASAADADTAGEYSYDVTTGAVKVAAVNSAVGITATGVPKISRWPAIIDFGSAAEGCITLPDAQTVTITNNENNPVGGYSVTGNSTDFNVSYTSAAIAANGTSTFTVQPVAGLVPGTHIAELTITTIEGNTATVDLSFTVNEESSGVTCCAITATAGVGGSISPSGNTDVAYGNDKTYTITADNGYEIQDVLVDGVSVGAVSSYTFENVKKAHTITASFTEKKVVNPFSDVGNSDWFYDNVMYVYQNGLMNGTESHTFSPNSGMTRGMFVTVLYRLSGDTGSYTSSFTDVPSGKWYENAVAWAAQNGISGGVANNRFAPDSGITRQQLAVLLYNYAKYKGYDVSIGEDTNILSYKDALDISDYAFPALQWACGAGIMNGNNESLNPNGPATRAQVAAMLERFGENTAK